MDENFYKFFTALLMALSALMSFLANRKAAESKQVSIENKADLQEIKVSSNGQHIALIEATRIAADATGHERARKEGEDKASTLAEGQIVGMAVGKAAAVDVFAAKATYPTMIPVVLFLAFALAGCASDRASAQLFGKQTEAQ